MEYDEIKKLIKKTSLTDDEKTSLLEYLAKYQKIEPKEKSDDKQFSKIESFIKTEFKNLLKEKFEKLEQFFIHSTEKENTSDTNSQDALNELIKKVNPEMHKFIPNLNDDKKFQWLQNAIDGGLFENGTEEIGSEIPVSNDTSKKYIRTISQKEISNMSKEEYEKLKKNGNLDYLIRNNLITD